MHISIKFCLFLNQTLASICDRIGNIKIVQFEALQEIRNKKVHNQLHLLNSQNQYKEKNSYILLHSSSFVLYILVKFFVNEQ